MNGLEVVGIIFVVIGALTSFALVIASEWEEIRRTIQRADPIDWIGFFAIIAFILGIIFGVIGAIV